MKKIYPRSKKYFLFNLKYKNWLNALAVVSLIVSIGLGCKLDLDPENGSQTKNDPPSNPTDKKRPTREKRIVEEDPDTRPIRNVSSNGEFVAKYSAIKNQTYVAFNESMKKQRILEGITDRLNSSLALPKDVYVTFIDCGVPNAFYSPKDESIIVCYEFMDLFYTIFTKMGKSDEEATQLMYDATTFFFCTNSDIV